MPARPPPLPIALMACLMLAAPAGAGWISEVSPIARDAVNLAASVSTIPRYVELAGLSPNPAASLHLIVLNASSGSFQGMVLEAITVPSAPGLQLVTDGVWPTDTPPYPLDETDLFTPLGTGQTLPIAGARSLLLFDRLTALAAGVGKIQDNLDRLGNAVLLDALTFGPDGQTAAYGDEPVIALISGQVLARPSLALGDPDPDTVLVGFPTASHLLPITPPFKLNPGGLNATWTPTIAPEPGSGLILATLGVIGAAGRLGRRRRPRRWPYPHRGLSFITLRGPGPQVAPCLDEGIRDPS